jgi:hypothetical protein
MMKDSCCPGIATELLSGFARIRYIPLCYTQYSVSIFPFMALPYLKRLVISFQPQWPGCEIRSDHVGFVVYKMALGHIFSGYFGFPCQYLFHLLLHIHHILSCGAGTICKSVADVQSGLSVSPNHKKLNYFRSAIYSYF